MGSRDIEDIGSAQDDAELETLQFRTSQAGSALGRYRAPRLPGPCRLRRDQTTLSIDMMLKEPEMLGTKSAMTQLRILAGPAQKVIRDLAPLA